MSASSWLFFGPLAAAAPDSLRAEASRAVDLEFRRSGASLLELDRGALFARLCEAGWDPACQRAAWQVRGVPDLATAAALLAPDCVGGDPVSCTVVGWHALQSADEAEQIDGVRGVRDACEDGHGPACEAWGEALYRSVAVESTEAQGIARWTASCAARERSSCRSLAAAQIQSGQTAAARKSAAGACHAGDLGACLIVADLDAVTWDAAQAWEYLGGLCDLGSGAACGRFSAGLSDGRWTGVDEDPFTLSQRGCALLDPASCIQAATAALALSTPDHASANNWLQQGCALGDPAACTAHVERVLTGADKTPVAEDEAAFDRACLDAGHARACGALGSALWAGGKPADPGRVRSLLVASCTEVDPSPTGCTDLAQIYEDGNGVQRDRTLAARFYGRACNVGVADACNRRGRLLLDGSGVRRDEAAALADLDAGCRLGNASACLGAADLVARGSPMIAADPGRALSLYATACAAGEVAGCLRQGQMLELGTADVADPTAARVAYERAVAAGSAEGRHHLARLLWNGAGGKKDKARARLLAAEACQAGDAGACRGPAALSL